jgi:hypothetical protein
MFSIIKTSNFIGLFPPAWIVLNFLKTIYLLSIRTQNNREIYFYIKQTKEDE